MPLPSEIAAVVDVRTEHDEDAPTTPVPSCCLLSGAGLCRSTSRLDTEVHRAVLQSVAGKWACEGCCCMLQALPSHQVI